jgi:hypothetical protein
MTKPKTKAPQQRTELDRIAAQLRTMLRRDTTSVIEKGKLLLRSRELLADEHGQWMPWLAENFDMSYRSAINYCKAAEYVARKSKFATVANFANLAPTVLYWLAEGHYTAEEEAAILAAAKAGKRIDQDAAWAIRDALAPPDDDDDEKDDDAEDSEAVAAEEDPEIKAVLDGPPPAVPPSAPIPPPTDYALRTFDEAVTDLKQLVTKSVAQFSSTIHSADDLEKVEQFINGMMKTKAKTAP